MVNLTGTGTVALMRTTYRRPRGTEVVHIHTTLLPEAKTRLDEIAARAGVPLWAAAEAAIMSGELDEHGIPTTWNLPRPSSDALPLENRKTA